MRPDRFGQAALYHQGARNAHREDQRGQTPPETIAAMGEGESRDIPLEPTSPDLRQIGAAQDSLRRAQKPEPARKAKRSSPKVPA